ncbi:MAG TPA: glycosyltransferase family 2 protein [Candidatus Paceibacterota bacterium]|nr:glycosyltransferase family 2 protein [Candidatus Paceibacterota bacterium]
MKVSILVNAYNEERYLKEALDSALAQTFGDFELVVLDDQSTDRTPEIVKEYTDPRVRYVRPAQRLGLVGGRNELLRQSRGEYLTYLDADDIYLPTKVEEEVLFLEQHPDCAAAYCDLGYFFDGDPGRLYRHRYEFYSGPDVFPNLLEKMFITNTAVMFRRRVYEEIGGYRSEMGIVEDWDYFLRMAYVGYQIVFLEKDLVRYRLRWDSHTNFARQQEIKESAVKIFEDLRSRMPEEDRARYHIDRWVADRKEAYAVTLAAAGEGRKARAMLKEAATYVGFLKRAAIVTLSFLPGSLAGTLVEWAWDWKKKNLFIPI